MINVANGTEIEQNTNYEFQFKNYEAPLVQIIE